MTEEIIVKKIKFPKPMLHIVFLVSFFMFAWLILIPMYKMKRMTWGLIYYGLFLLSLIFFGINSSESLGYNIGLLIGGGFMSFASLSITNNTMILLVII